MTTSEQAWSHWAVARIEADYNRSADTHLIPVSIPALPEIALYLKDESSHPTGSLKHRLARSLFLYALCNGWIRKGRPIIEASSGSTAVSEAYFARMLGLPFVAVLPSSTAKEKIAAIEFQGGACHFVETPAEMYETAARLASEMDGHYLDQFTYAERATDWRGNNNIAESIFLQMRRERRPVPSWIVCGAGTGGTSATMGRYTRYNQLSTQICVADPDASVFHRYWNDRDVRTVSGPPSLVEGIGRPRVEASFLPDVVDRMIAVSDCCSIAATRVISARLGRLCGGSTGTNLWACARIATEMAAAGEKGSIVTILCDSGERYRTTYFNDDWLAAHGIDCRADEERFAGFLDSGALPD